MVDDGGMLELFQPIKKPTRKQQQAAALAAAGMNDTQVAQEAGVTRQTVRNWRMKSAGFNQALIEAQRGLYLEQHDRLTRLVNEALNVLETNLQSADARVRNQAAGLVLRCAGAETRGWKWAWNVRDRVGR